MTPLSNYDMKWLVRRLPKTVADLLQKYGGDTAPPAEVGGAWRVLTQPRLFLAGGFIRSVIANEQVNDIDLFVNNEDDASLFAEELAEASKFGRVYKTQNAVSVLNLKPYTVQFIHRWTFNTPASAIDSFDYTVARAALWCMNERVGDAVIPHWHTLADEGFYPDLAAKRLVYKSPDRNEDAGGSILRLLKFYQRGYRVPLDSLSRVIARLLTGVKEGSAFWRGLYDDMAQPCDAATNESYRAKILLGLLKEVDPNAVTEDQAFTPPGDDSDATD